MMRLGESRGSGTGTDMESMDTSVQGLCQQPSFSAVKTSTPKQSQDPHFYELFQQTQSLLSDFLKQSRERQPFYNFLVAEANKFSDAQYNNFQPDVLNLL